MGVSGDMSLSNTDIHNLLVFMERVQLMGGEAVTFVQLVQKLQIMRGDENADCNQSRQDTLQSGKDNR